MGSNISTENVIVDRMLARDVPKVDLIVVKFIIKPSNTFVLRLLSPFNYETLIANITSIISMNTPEYIPYYTIEGRKYFILSREDMSSLLIYIDIEKKKLISVYIYIYEDKVLAANS